MVKVRVLLVDDDALVRAGLRMILSSSDEMEVVEPCCVPFTYRRADPPAVTVTATCVHVVSDIPDPPLMLPATDPPANQSTVGTPAEVSPRANAKSSESRPCSATGQQVDAGHDAGSSIASTVTPVTAGRMGSISDEYCR